MTQKWIWLGGWGIAPAEIERLAIARWPGFSHRAIIPGQDWKETTTQAIEEGIDFLVGYSLGAFLFIRDRLAYSGRCTLLAPFLDFRAEHSQGGKVSTTQLKFLIRWLKRDSLRAVDDFYRTAGLSIPVPRTLPYPVEDLIWGIEQLLTTSANSSNGPEAATAIGRNDLLLDATALTQLFPEIKLLPNTGHDLADLIHAIELN